MRHGTLKKAEFHTNYWVERHEKINCSFWWY